MARKRRFNRKYGRRKRVKFSKRSRRGRARRKFRRVSKKLKSTPVFGGRISPRAAIVKMKWFQDYISNSLTGTNFVSTENNGQNGFFFTQSTGYYHKRFNISSLLHPDLLVTTTGQTHTAVNWKEFALYYTKWFVRACKIKIWMKAQQANGSDSSENAPVQCFIWCDNNNNNNVSTSQQAMAQPGCRYLVIPNAVYGDARPTWFKGYYKAKNVLRRQIDESVDFGTVFTTGAGVDPPDNSCMFLHILWRGGATSGSPQYVNMGIILKQYTKYWDTVEDQIDEDDPNL